MPVQETVEAKFDSLPNLPRKWWGYIHLHYPSGNPHGDQAVHVDIRAGADAGGNL
jgi:hypothetical protein